MLPILKKECMVFQTDVCDKQGAKEMVEVLNREGYLKDKEVFHKDVLDREAVFSTYIGYGIGLPHGKSRGVGDAGLCIARLNNPVVWTDHGSQAVELIIMIAVNDESAGDLHLQILSKLSRLLMHEEFRAELMSGDKDEVYQTLAGKLEV